MTQPIVPAVFRTGNPVVDRNLDEIAKAFRRLQMGGTIDDHRAIVDATDTPGTLEAKIVGTEVSKIGAVGARQIQITPDHLVKASTSDATTAGGLLEKTLDSTTITRALATDGGISKLQFTAIASPYVDSIPPIHANDQAVFLCDEFPTISTAELSNSGHDSGNMSFHAGTVKQGAYGLRGTRCLHMLTDGSFTSAVAKWEYQTFSVHFWFFLETLPLLANPVVGVSKMSNPGAFTTPFYSVGLALNSTNLTARILKTVSPREYVDVISIPDVNQFLLGSWHHVAMTWDGQYLILYINGTEYSRSAAQTGITVQYDNQGQWVLGHPYGTTSASKFAIQDVRINNTALSADYILDVYRRGATMLSRAPKVYG